MSLSRWIFTTPSIYPRFSPLATHSVKPWAEGTAMTDGIRNAADRILIATIGCYSGTYKRFGPMVFHMPPSIPRLSPQKQRLSRGYERLTLLGSFGVRKSYFIPHALYSISRGAAPDVIQPVIAERLTLSSKRPCQGKLKVRFFADRNGGISLRGAHYLYTQ